MVVYGDVLFALNLLLDYAVLLASAKIAACPFVRLRLLGGALFGAVYAVAVFVPGLQILSALPLKLCAGTAMALIAFGGQHRFFNLLLVLFGVTMAMGGGVLALTALGSAAFPRGVAVTGTDLLAVVVAGSAGYALLTFGFRRRAAHASSSFVEVGMGLADREIHFRALVDTGNTLTDRSQRRVIVVDWQRLNDLLPEQAKLEKSKISAPGNGFEMLARTLGPDRAQLISFRTVGQNGGLLLGLKPDWVQIGRNGKRRTDVLAVFSPNPVSDGGAYQGLTGPEEMGGI